jgi:hypothetical protein
MVLLLLICCHFFSGYGLLRLFRIRQRPLVMLPLAFILGVAVASFLPFLLALLHCPLYPVTVFGILGAVCFGLNAGWVCRSGVMGKIVQTVKEMLLSASFFA